MTFILFETGSAKWLQATSSGGHRFTSTLDFATPFNSSSWTLEKAIDSIGATKYKDTIIAHSLVGKPIRF